MSRNVLPLGQEGRRPCSLPLHDADLSLGNANWTKGLQAMSDWVWSGNLNPIAFPNNLARYFLQIPAIFEQQLNFSATLIFDEPSFRNGIQMSGFIDRVSRELVISLIAQRRRAWYSMTHHAVLGYLTAKKHGLSDSDFGSKWSSLTEYARHPELFSEVELAVLEFADAFATNPKAYSDDQYKRLREALAEDNRLRYPAEGKWMTQLEEARKAFSLGLSAGMSADECLSLSQQAAGAVEGLSDEANEVKINAQVVELAFLCLQFVALTDVFSALNIPDESFLADVMTNLLPDEVISRINELNMKGGTDLPAIVPPKIDPPLAAILNGSVEVETAPLKGTRIPLVPYETNMPNDRDKGLTVGGAQVAVYGWSFGLHFPGSLIYALMLHPELSRYEPPYSLPLLFNEDEWRNGTQTGGYVSRLLKELVFQKIYKITRTRYGLEHHAMFLYNSYLDLYGANRPPSSGMTPEQRKRAREIALQKAENAILYIVDHMEAPDGVYTALERSVLTWVQIMITSPHDAYKVEGEVRENLEHENRREVAAGTRRLDNSPGIGEDAAFKRLVDHQVAELAMITGHMDGLGRALTILRLEVEEAVQTIEGKVDPKTGDIKPDLNENGGVISTGYFNSRPGWLDSLAAIGVSKRVLTINELMVNPTLNELVRQKLEDGETEIRISAETSLQSGEF